MKIDPYLHSVLVLQGAGKEVTADAIAHVLKAAGVDADHARAKILADAVKGVNFDDLLKQAAAAPVAAAPAAAAPAGKADKKEEKDEKKSEEEAAAGLASLFG
ncbi:50S ribosomal protein L12 [Candidatus Gugararchaeum adminiculabundum]|nr:50S ribosomal protein L12 [Candidatus Gugararchaeum adminiculabundum]